MAQRIGEEEHHRAIEEQEHAQPETVLGRVIGVEGNVSLLAFTSTPVGFVDREYAAPRYAGSPRPE
jgi:hypothetical protein